MSDKRWRNIRGIKEQITNHLTKKVKGIIFAIAASLVIGVIFGIVSLQMAQKDDTIAGVTNKMVQTNEQETEETTFDEIDFYVVQAGIFQKKENAEKWASLLKKEGLPAVQWKRDKEIYLLSGIDKNEEETRALESKVKEANFDAFVKGWKLSQHHSTVNENDKVYLDSFLNAFELSLETGDTSELTKLANNQEGLTEFVQPLKDKLDTLQREEKNEQQFLLEVAYVYESLFQ